MQCQQACTYSCSLPSQLACQHLRVKHCYVARTSPPLRWTSLQLNGTWAVLQMRNMEVGDRRGSAGAVADMALTACCRRKALLAYFGERRGRCESSEELCDFCSDPKAVVCIRAHHPKVALSTGRGVCTLWQLDCKWYGSIARICCTGILAIFESNSNCAAYELLSR